MPKPFLHELRGVLPSRMDGRNIANRDEAARVTSLLGARVLAPEDPIRLDQTANNNLFLTSGDHGGAVFDVAETTVRSAPGAVLSRPVVFRADTEVVGVRFTSTSSITISGTAVVRLIGCTIECGVAVNGTSTMIAAQCKFYYPIIQVNGAFVNALGCHFAGTSSILHAGPVAANANASACSRTSGVAHTFVTVFGETN